MPVAVSTVHLRGYLPSLLPVSTSIVYQQSLQGCALPNQPIVRCSGQGLQNQPIVGANISPAEMIKAVQTPLPGSAELSAELWMDHRCCHDSHSNLFKRHLCCQGTHTERSAGAAALCLDCVLRLQDAHNPSQLCCCGVENHANCTLKPPRTLPPEPAPLPRCR